jgi:hypothetical protein
MALALRLPQASPHRCRVCGCDPVRTDVVDPGLDLATLLLAECPRCDHRWTEPLQTQPLHSRRAAVAARPTLRSLREGASAA